MNIPPKYEDLVAQLESEKALSKTLLNQKETYMKLADDLKQRLVTVDDELQRHKGMYSSALDRESRFRHALMIANQRLAVFEGLSLKAGQVDPRFTEKNDKRARAPCGLRKDQIVEVIGGGQTQIDRVDKTDWRNVEMWRIKSTEQLNGQS